MLLSAQPLTAAAPPALSIKRALELAEEALRAKGAENQTFVQTISLERSTIFSPRGLVITWSNAIPGSKPGSREVGLEIDMKGEVVHLINARATKKLSSPH